MSWFYHVHINICLRFDFYDGRNIVFYRCCKCICKCRVGFRLGYIQLKFCFVPRFMVHILGRNGFCFCIIGHTAIAVFLNQSPFAVRSS